MRSLSSAIAVAAIVFGLAGTAQAAGTVSGSFQGPEGQAINTTVRFQKGTEVVSVNTTNGRFSQSLDPGEWSLNATAPPHPEYGAFSPVSIPRVKVDEGDSFDLGTMPVHFDAPDAAENQLDEFNAKPAICSDNGGPIIIRTYFTDEKKGNFLYPNRSTGLTVVADQVGYTVTGDYSIYENHDPGTDLFSMTDNGNGTYTGSFTVSNTQVGGGMVIVTVVGSGGATSRSCTDPGPYNLDIRQFLDGADTTNFAQVDDFRAIENFTMHKNGIVKITMRKPVNMLSQTVQRFFKSIGRTFEGRTGEFTLNAAAAVQLQKNGAEITFYNVSDQYLSAPEVLLDGGAAGSAVSNVVYDSSAKILTFKAAHFSSYKLAPKVTITAPTAGSTSTEQTITLKGTVNDLTAGLQVHINGIDAGTVVPNGSGQFAKTVKLTRSGSNTLTVVGCSSGACSSSQSTTVTYSPTTTTASTSSSSSSTTSSSSSSSSATTVAATTSSASSSSSSTLPKTGTNPWVSLGFLALVIAGAGLVVGARRARQQRA